MAVQLGKNLRVRISKTPFATLTDGKELKIKEINVGKELKTEDVTCFGDENTVEVPTGKTISISGSGVRDNTAEGIILLDELWDTDAIHYILVIDDINIKKGNQYEVFLSKYDDKATVSGIQELSLEWKMSGKVTKVTGV